jgi:hypothetical protein
MSKSNRYEIVASRTRARRLAGLASVALMGAVLAARPAGAQERDVTANDVWTGVTGDIRLTPKINFTFTSEERRSSGVQLPRQLFVFGGPMVQIGRGVRLGAGYGYYHTSPNEDFGPERPTGEHRIWQQLTGTHATFGAAFNHRLRNEQRWIAPEARDGEETERAYTSRVRHQIRVVAPLDGRSPAASRLYAMPHIELFVTTMNHKGVLFDHSRLGAALGFGVATRLNVEAGYMRQGIVHGGGRLEVHHVLQINARVLAGPRPER